MRLRPSTSFMASLFTLVVVLNPIGPKQATGSVSPEKAACYPGEQGETRERILVLLSPPSARSDDQGASGQPGPLDTSGLNRRYRDLGVIASEPIYPGILRHPILRAAISRIRVLTLTAGADPVPILRELHQDPLVLQTGRDRRPDLHYTPSDPRHTDQWHLQHTRVYEAWDTVRAEVTASTVIAIVDAGVCWEHPDLMGNMWINSPEDVNQNGRFDAADLDGVDADGNGYVDDVVGWDFGENDNDPREDTIEHGTAVAGAASEVTDNGLLGAAIGFAARLMAIKCFSQAGQFVAAYEGMIYAVDNGATVVNCSWGTLTADPVEQFIIDALWAAGALVVASAGAFDGVPMYPAAYEHVLAVTATDLFDVKASFANHGTWVDVCAPGVDIWTTSGLDDFTVYSGTSFATAMTAGLAGLIRAWDPALTVEATADLILAAAVDIDDLNPGYAGQLGAGRIDCAAWLPATIVSPQEPSGQPLAHLGNSPNPFNARTLIRYQLSRPGLVSLQVFDLAGKRVDTLVSRWQDRGWQTAVWDATSLASGTYFYVLEVGDQVARRKCLLVK